MTDGSHWYLVSYDVRDPKRLRKVMHIVRGFGEMVQYSVYRVFTGKTGMQRLRWKLERVMEPEDDLLVIPLCAKCAGRIDCRSERTSWDDEPEFEILD